MKKLKTIVVLPAYNAQNTPIKTVKEIREGMSIKSF